MQLFSITLPSLLHYLGLTSTAPRDSEISIQDDVLALSWEIVSGIEYYIVEASMNF
jgi:hypothetical protein